MVLETEQRAVDFEFCDYRIVYSVYLTGLFWPLNLIFWVV